MSIPTIYIDGTAYKFPMQLQRNIDKRESDNSGLLMNKRYHTDYLGTYISYNVSVVIPFGKEFEYANLFEMLALPIEEYSFTIPYNQETITFDGKIENLSDTHWEEYIDERNRKVTYWRHISFDIVSVEPILEVDTDENSDQ